VSALNASDSGAGVAQTVAVLRRGDGYGQE